MFKKPGLRLLTTTLWEYPSQHYGPGMQGDKAYVGATPSYIIWNLLTRYTRPHDLVVDPMCGSGTTIDVARDLGRKVIGYDIAPYRKDIVRADARKLPLEPGKADFIFIDPPYSDHIEYSGQDRCIGRLNAGDPAYQEAMDQVFCSCHRALRNRRHMGLYVCDYYNKAKGFVPTGFRLYGLLLKYFKPVDIVSVVRHNKALQMGNYHKAAEEENFFLRGFNYLFIVKKDDDPRPPHHPAAAQAPGRGPVPGAHPGGEGKKP